MNSTRWHQYTLTYTGRTDPGLRRDHNEDNLLVMPEAALFCVADGAGGHAAGDKASSITLSSISSVIERIYNSTANVDITQPLDIVINPDSDKPAIVQAISHANTKVNANITSSSMASTIVACHFDKEAIYIAHVGDSRAYLVRDNTLSQLTSDHSLVNELFKLGKITEEEVQTHPRRNIITRAVGPAEEVAITCNTFVPEENDILLLCSDGLNSMISDAAILAQFQPRQSLDDIAAGLIKAANDAGGRDNVTVVLIQIGR